jgi:hypothetical protein
VPRIPPDTAAAPRPPAKCASIAIPGSDPSACQPPLAVRTPTRLATSFGPSGETGRVSVSPPFPSGTMAWGWSEAMRPSSEKKCASAGVVRGPAPEPTRLTVSLTVAGESRVA